MIHITIAAANDCFHHQLILGTLSSFRDLGFLYINLFLYSFIYIISASKYGFAFLTR